MLIHERKLSFYAASSAELSHRARARHHTGSYLSQLIPLHATSQLALLLPLSSSSSHIGTTSFPVVISWPCLSFCLSLLTLHFIPPSLSSPSFYSIFSVFLTYLLCAYSIYKYRLALLFIYFILSSLFLPLSHRLHSFFTYSSNVYARVHFPRC
jgi:hypothetical protein